MVAVYRSDLEPNGLSYRKLEKPTVLVLLAAFNGSDWIQEQLRSVMEQEDVEVRILVRDDGSTDRTVASVQSLRSAGQIELSVAAAPTGSAAQNFFSLIRDNPAVGFDFVAFADQDDVWEKDKLARACRQIRLNGAAGYSSAVTAVWPGAPEQVLRQVDRTTEADYLFEGAGQGCTFVLTADFYGRARDFILANPDLTRQIHFHDWATYALARVWDQRWHFDSQPTMKYRQHGGNHLGARYGLRGISRRLSLIRSGWYRDELRRVADFCGAAAPSNERLRGWQSLLTQPDCFRKRLEIARFCHRSGRRRRADRIVLMLAGMAGWI